MPLENFRRAASVEAVAVLPNEALSPCLEMPGSVFVNEVMMARSIVFTAILVGLAVLPAGAQESLFENCRRIQLPAMVDYPEVQSLVEPELRNLCGQVVTTMAAVQPILGIAFPAGIPCSARARHWARGQASHASV